MAALLALACVVDAGRWILGPDSLDRVVVGMVINLILVVGLYAFVGLSGVFSFGHAAFVAIGAYTAAMLTIPPRTKPFVLPGVPGFLARPAPRPVPGDARGLRERSPLSSASYSPVPLARLSGLTAGLATFAVLVIVNVVAKNWQQLTHGTAGVSGIPTATTGWGALAWAARRDGRCWALQRSRIGLRLRASREQEAAARSIGIGVSPRARRSRLCVWAFFAGVAGALLAMFIGSANPNAFYLDITFLMVAMLVVGGTTSLAGAVIGTIVISAAAEILRRVEGGIDLGVVELPSRPGLREVGARAPDARHPHPPARKDHRRP